jgi:hypothetical protein
VLDKQRFVIGQQLGEQRKAEQHKENPEATKAPGGWP